MTGASIKRLRRGQVHIAVAIAGVAVACGGDADQRVTAQVDTIGGVVVVRNGSGLWRESEQWQVVEDFRVGEVGGERIWTRSSAIQGTPT